MSEDSDLPRFGAKMRGDSDVNENDLQGVTPGEQDMTDQEKEAFMRQKKVDDALKTMERYKDENHLLGQFNQECMKMTVQG